MTVFCNWKWSQIVYDIYNYLQNLVIKIDKKMKIWIIVDNIYWLNIMNRLSKYDHEYHIYIDNQNSFRWDKNREIWIEWIKEWIKYLETKWVNKIILPPIYEMAFLLDPRYKKLDLGNWPISQNTRFWKNQSSCRIANIYISYLQNYAAKYSLVGKLWFVGDLADMEFLELYISQILSDFKPSVHQANNKQFMKPFWVYRKQVPMRKYLWNHLSANNILLNNVIKNDLKKIKSYNIDTLIPLNYAFWTYSKSIKHSIGKIKFHDVDILEKIRKWLELEWDNTWSSKSEYFTNIYITDNNKLLLGEKKRKWLLCRGKSVERNIELV